MARWLYFLLLALPAALLARILALPPLVIFVLAGIALVPLAALISSATETLAEHTGPLVGGLLNATFGNAAELIIGLTALAAGLTDVVRASIAGSIIGNALLVLGTAMLLGGWRFGVQRFNARNAGQYAAMLALTVIGLAIPSLMAVFGGTDTAGGRVRGTALHELSIIVALVLLLCYVAYIAFTVFGVHAYHREPGRERRTHSAPEQPLPLGQQRVAQQHGGRASLFARGGVGVAALVLAGATALTAVASETLVGTIEHVSKQVGLNAFFVGLIVLPLVGNAAEHSSAITMALRNHMETAMAITAGSSIQVALLVAPLLVLLSPVFGTVLDLSFQRIELVIFGLVAGLYAVISLDGESTWLEGLLLLAFYLIVGVSAFFVPA